MTCFWDSLLRGIPRDFFEDRLQHHPASLAMYLKSRNRKTDTIKICGQLLNDQRKEENFEAIKNYDPNTVGLGYFCAAEDPFLFLISEVFQISIYHTFLGKMFDYVHPSPRLKLHLYSRTGHMSFIRVDR